MSAKKAVFVSAMLAMVSLSAQADTTPAPAASTPAPAAGTPAQADNKAPGSGPNPFADCGIGAALFTETKWAAVTSNVIWDVGTTALTSATASPQTCNGKRVAAAVFINDTYDKLAEETARGEGEHLTTVLNILQCDGSRHAQAIDAARGAMGGLVAEPGYNAQPRREKASRFYDVVEAAVAQGCSA